MEFKHLKLLGTCSAVTLLFCSEANGMDLSTFMRSANIRAEQTGDQQIKHAVRLSREKVRSKIEQKKNNSSSVNTQRNTKSSVIRKIKKTSMGSEQAFSKWMGRFKEGLIADEEQDFFSHSEKYVCRLVDHDSKITRNAKEYGNQCATLALNLDEKLMSKLYDEVDKFEDYGHNFAQYIEDHNGLDDGNGELWNRISSIIKHRVCIYSRQSDGTLTSIIFGENDLPIKRIYLEKGHYRELLISEDPKAKVSEQRQAEEKNRDAEAPKQEKKLKTVEDVRKEFVDAINAKRKQGEEKIDILKEIFENSGLTDNEELKADMNLLLSFFGTRLGDFNFICENVSARIREVYEACRRFFVDEHLKQLQNQNAVDISKEELDMLSKTLEKSKEGPKQNVMKDLFDVREKQHSLSLKHAKQLVEFWKSERDGRKIEDDLSTLLKGELNRRISSINDLDERIKGYQNALKLLWENRISYNNPTLEQAREFSREQAEKAIRLGAITMQIEHHDCVNWNICYALEKAVSDNGGQLKKQYRRFYSENQYASAFNSLISSNRELFNNPEFMRKREVADLFKRLRPRVRKEHGDKYEAVFEIISKL